MHDVDKAFVLGRRFQDFSVVLSTSSLFVPDVINKKSSK